MSKNGDNRNIRVLQFLDAYEKQECLWNPALESYKNKSARDEAYLRIIQELNVPFLTIHDVKLKVKSIRTTYTKELRLLTKHKEQGKHSYNPKLFWFNRANAFLKNVSLSRDRRTDLPAKIDASSENLKHKSCIIDYMTHRQCNDDQPTDDISNAEDPGNTTPSAFEYKSLRESHIQGDSDLEDGQIEEESSSLKQTFHQQNEFNTNLAATNVNPKFVNPTSADTPSITQSLLVTSQATPINNMVEDEYEVFCRSVAAQLRSITDTYSRSVAKLKIQQILFEAETGHYRNSPVSLYQSTTI